MADGGAGCEYVSLYRKNSSQPWGFRMVGGLDQGCCLYIAKVNPRSLAERHGLRAGDAVLRIGQLPATHLNHQPAKAEILRAGNELHFVVKRGAVRVPEDSEQQVTTERSVVVEEETQYRGERKSSIQSRCFRIITESLVEEMNELPGPHGNPSTTNVTTFR